jgi:diadenosine tetraphosphatase ApaH/serine/threonine PP2A family protein phosphatase
MRKEQSFWLTHAAPFWPESLATLADLNANPYAVSGSRLFPYLHNESDLLWEALALLARAKVPLMFHGHTHRQMAWRFAGDNRLERLSGGSTVSLTPGDTLIVGVGSVGRSLDGPGAAYVIFDDMLGEVEMVRV